MSMGHTSVNSFVLRAEHVPKCYVWELLDSLHCFKMEVFLDANNGTDGQKRFFTLLFIR